MFVEKCRKQMINKYDQSGISKVFIFSIFLKNIKTLFLFLDSRFLLRLKD